MATREQGIAWSTSQDTRRLYHRKGALASKISENGGRSLDKDRPLAVPRFGTKGFSDP